MKKFLSLILTLTLVFVLTACSNKKDTSTSVNTPSEVDSKDTESAQETKTALFELLPTCKDFLQKSISNGNLTADLKTEYNQNDIDITISNNSIGVLSMRLYITYPTKQTPYSDAKITGIRISAAYYDESSQKHHLQKYVSPYIEYFPNALNNEQDILAFIISNGKVTSELKTAPKAQYNEITTIYEFDGITYTYTENILVGSELSFHDVLEIEVNKDYDIYLSDYPDFHYSK